MKSLLTGSLLAIAFTGLLAAQTPPQRSKPQAPPSPPPKVLEMTLTGCIVEGSAPGVYILDNAVDPEKRNDKPRAFRLEGGGQDMDFMQHVNHKVLVSGTAEMKAPAPPPAGGQISEKDLPVFTAKMVTGVADVCTR